LLANNGKKEEVKKSKQQEDLARENTNDYIRKNERIHYIDDYWKGRFTHNVLS
jgi:hypothetical protein